MSLKSLITCCQNYMLLDQQQSQNIQNIARQNIQQNYFSPNFKPQLSATDHHFIGSRLHASKSQGQLRKSMENYSIISNNQDRSSKFMQPLPTILEVKNQAVHYATDNKYRSSHYFYSPNVRKQTFLSPFSGQIKMATSATKDKIRFSHNFIENLQNYRNSSGNLIMAVPEISHRNIVGSSYQPIQQLPQRQQNYQPTLVRNTLPNQDSSAPVTPVKSLKNINNKTSQNSRYKYPSRDLTQTKYTQHNKSFSNRLASSIITVKSRQSAQNNGEVGSYREQESAILVDVFHPTSSQMQQWKINKKNSMETKKSFKG